MRIRSKFRTFVLLPLLAAAGAGIVLSSGPLNSSQADAAAPAAPAAAFPPLSPNIPGDIAGTGGARTATLMTAATFAWQEFIALNWPAKPQNGAPNTRGFANIAQKFGTDTASQPVVWETLRSKVETFPGVGNPPGYQSVSGIANPDFGYDHLPSYVYGTRTATGPVQNNPGGPILIVPACKGQGLVATPAFVNLDETSQIGEDDMSAGVVPAAATTANAQPQLIRFLAKGNRTFYDYVAKNQFWYHSQSFVTAQSNFANAAAANTYPPKQPVISLPTGTILVKAAWRVLAPTEKAANFHTKNVRYYENIGTAKNPVACYREQTWALIGLHIIQKTPTAPDFIYATFEYTGNILNPNGTPVEDQNGNQNPNPPSTATTPVNTYFDADGTFYSPDFPKGTKTVKPPPGVTLPINIANGAYCPVAGGTTPAQNARSYYINAQFHPKDGNVLPASGVSNLGFCVNKRYFPIPAGVVQVNAAAHAALAVYGAPALWQNYKLVNVQWMPFRQADIDTTGVNTSRLAATYYQSNSVIETDDVLQQFFGALTYTGLKSGYETDPKMGHVTLAQPAYNIYGPGPNPLAFSRLSMGGCMGCHGRAQRGGADFSFTLNNGPVGMPDVPAGQDAARLELMRATLAGAPKPKAK